MKQVNLEFDHTPKKQEVLNYVKNKKIPQPVLVYVKYYIRTTRSGENLFGHKSFVVYKNEIYTTTELRNHFPILLPFNIEELTEKQLGNLIEIHKNTPKRKRIDKTYLKKWKILDIIGEEVNKVFKEKQKEALYHYIPKNEAEKWNISLALSKKIAEELLNYPIPILEDYKNFYLDNPMENTKNFIKNIDIKNLKYKRIKKTKPKDNHTLRLF